MYVLHLQSLVITIVCVSVFTLLRAFTAHASSLGLGK